MTKRTCPVCLSEIPATRGPGRPRRFCSSSCRKWNQRHLADHLPCSVPECARPRTARGLCPAHYIQSQCPDRHGVEVVACAACGWLVEKSTSRSKKRRPVCSTRCRYYVTYGRWPRNEIVGPVRFAKSTTAPLVEIPSSRRGFLAVECEWCDVRFIHDWRVTGVAPRFCSSRCRKQAGKVRSRLAKGQFSISRRERLAIYERDGWVCQLCHEPVEPDAPNGDLWSATLDHIIPQSHTLIPDHSAANLRLAHLWCNSVRGDESYYTAADLVVA